MRQPRWGIFISGQGSNMSALLDMRWKLDIALVVSSRANAYGLLRARRSGIPTLLMNEEMDWQQLLKTLTNYQVDHLFLLGFLKIVPPEFLQAWNKTTLNVHPSLLPSYPGLKSIERAWKDQAPVGVSVHHVVPEVDAGEIVLQRKIEVMATELKEVEQQVHELEYDLVRRAVEKKYA